MTVLIDQTGELAKSTFSLLPNYDFILDEAKDFAQAFHKQKKNLALPMSEDIFLLLFLHKKKIALLVTKLKRNIVMLNTERENFDDFEAGAELYNLKVLPNTRIHEFLYPKSFEPSAFQITELEESWRMFTLVGDQTTGVDAKIMSLANLRNIDNKQFISDAQTNLFPAITLTEYNNYMGGMFITATPFDGIAYASPNKIAEERIDLLSPLDNEHMFFNAFGNPAYFTENYAIQETNQTGENSFMIDLDVFKDALNDWSKDISLWTSIYKTKTYTVNKVGTTNVSSPFPPNDASTLITFVPAGQQIPASFEIATQSFVSGEFMFLEPASAATYLKIGQGHFEILKETLLSETETTRTIFCEGYVKYVSQGEVRIGGITGDGVNYVLMQKSYDHQYTTRPSTNAPDPDNPENKQFAIYTFKSDDILLVKYFQEDNNQFFGENHTFHRLTTTGTVSTSLSDFPSGSANVFNSLELPLPAGGGTGSGSDFHTREIFINKNVSFTLSSSQNVSYTRYPTLSGVHHESSTNRDYSRPMSLGWEDYLTEDTITRFTSGWPQPEITFSVYNTLFDDGFVHLLNPKIFQPDLGTIKFGLTQRTVILDSPITSESQLSGCYKGTVGLTLDDRAGINTSAWNSQISGGQPAQESGEYPGSNFYESTQSFPTAAQATTYSLESPHPFFSVAGAYKGKGTPVNIENKAWIRGITSKTEHKDSSTINIITVFGPPTEKEQVALAADSLSVNGQSIPVGTLNNPSKPMYVIKDVAVTGYSILPIGSFFRWCYLINKTKNVIGLCKFYWTTPIKTLLQDYYDIQSDLISAARTRASNPDSIDPVFSTAINLRLQLDDYFNTIGIIENNFMSYQLIHMAVQSGYTIVYIYTNEESLDA